MAAMDALPSCKQPTSISDPGEWHCSRRFRWRHHRRRPTLQRLDYILPVMTSTIVLVVRRLFLQTAPSSSTGSKAQSCVALLVARAARTSRGRAGTEANDGCQVATTLSGMPAGHGIEWCGRAGRRRLACALRARHACHPPRARHGGTPVCSIRLQGSRPAIALAPVRCRMESILGSYEEGGGSQERPGLGAAPARGGRAGPK